MKLIPFDLEKALAGEPVVTRDRQEVNDLHYFINSSDKKKLYGIINGEINSFNDDGRYNGNSYYSSDFDLFMKLPEPKEFWINVYKHEGKLILSSFSSKEEAEKNISEICSNYYVKTICVEV